MGDGTAEGTGQGESGVEVDTAELARSRGGGLLDDGIDLVGASGRHGRGGHCDWRRTTVNGNEQDKHRGMEWSWIWREAMRCDCENVFGHGVVMEDSNNKFCPAENGSSKDFRLWPVAPRPPQHRAREGTGVTGPAGMTQTTLPGLRPAKEEGSTANDGAMCFACACHGFDE